MSLNKYKLKLSKTGDRSGEMPQYALTYKPGARRISHVSHDILSALIGARDVMIELSTDLLFGPRGKEQTYAEGFLKQIGAFPAAVRNRTVLSGKRNALFGIALNKKKKEMAEEVVAYVPNAVWREATFADIIPLYGARYYVVKEPVDAEAAVDGFWEMGEDEKEDTFLLRVFNVAMLGQAGIDTGMGEEALRGMLGL